jgi:hypothetical protein
MRAAAESAMIVVFTFQSSPLEIIESPRSALKLDPYRGRATSAGEGEAFRLGDVLVGAKLPDDFGCPLHHHISRPAVP